MGKDLHVGYVTWVVGACVVVCSEVGVVGSVDVSVVCSVVVVVVVDVVCCVVVVCVVAVGVVCCVVDVVVVGVVCCVVDVVVVCVVCFVVCVVVSVVVDSVGLAARIAGTLHKFELQHVPLTPLPMLVNCEEMY